MMLQDRRSSTYRKPVAGSGVLTLTESRTPNNPISPSNVTATAELLHRWHNATNSSSIGSDGKCHNLPYDLTQETYRVILRDKVYRIYRRYWVSFQLRGIFCLKTIFMKTDCNSLIETDEPC